MSTAGGIVTRYKYKFVWQSLFSTCLILLYSEWIMYVIQQQGLSQGTKHIHQTGSCMSYSSRACHKVHIQICMAVIV